MYLSQVPLVLWLFKVLSSLGQWAVGLFFVVSHVTLDMPCAVECVEYLMCVLDCSMW